MHVSQPVEVIIHLLLLLLFYSDSIGTNNEEYNIILNRLVSSLFSSKLQKTPSPNKETNGSDNTDVPLPMDCIGLMVMHTRGRYYI